MIRMTTKHTMVLLAMAVGACAPVVPPASGGAPERDPADVTADRVDRVQGMGSHAPDVRIQQENVTLSDEVPGNPEAVLEALRAAYEELGFEALRSGSQVVIQPQGFPRTVADRRASYYLDCGTDMHGAVADNASVEMGLVATVSPAGTGSRISTRVQASAERRAVRTGTFHCLTRGRLEALAMSRMILAEIR